MPFYFELLVLVIRLLLEQVSWGLLSVWCRELWTGGEGDSHTACMHTSNTMPHVQYMHVLCVC